MRGFSRCGCGWCGLAVVCLGRLSGRGRSVRGSHAGRCAHDVWGWRVGVWSLATCSSAYRVHEGVGEVKEPQSAASTLPFARSVREDHSRVYEVNAQDPPVMSNVVRRRAGPVGTPTGAALLLIDQTRCDLQQQLLTCSRHCIDVMLYCSLTRSDSAGTMLSRRYGGPMSRYFPTALRPDGPPKGDHDDFKPGAVKMRNLDPPNSILALKPRTSQGHLDTNESTL